jgi:Fur family ferric uptake transcriptional regulator
MPGADKAIERFNAFLQKNGLKVTKERAGLVREIFGTRYHFDADELLETLKQKGIKTSRATIYRTLELLVRSGVVRRVHLGEDHYHYEWVGKGAHHDHLVCTTCGAVIEFHDPGLEARQGEICKRYNFQPTFHNLQILGVCQKCQKKGELPDAPDRVKMIEEGATKLRK